MSLLEVTGLTHSFGDNYLFKNADFSLNKGGTYRDCRSKWSRKKYIYKILYRATYP